MLLLQIFKEQWATRTRRDPAVSIMHPGAMHFSTKDKASNLAPGGFYILPLFRLPQNSKFFTLSPSHQFLDICMEY
jgi:hypothetical protein